MTRSGPPRRLLPNKTVADPTDWRLTQVRAVLDRQREQREQDKLSAAAERERQQRHDAERDAKVKSAETSSRSLLRTVSSSSAEDEFAQLEKAFTDVAFTDVAALPPPQFDKADAGRRRDGRMKPR